MGRPGLTLLARQGRAYHGEKFLELEAAFRDRIVRGEFAPEAAGEAAAPQSVELDNVIGGLRPHDFVLEAEYEVGDSFRRAHDLGPLVTGAAVAGGGGLAFASLRPDILQVLPPPADGGRRIITPSGGLVRSGPADRRLGLRIIDIKLAGEPSPSHFAELAYYGMALAGWLEDTGRGDRYAVLNRAAIWPGSLDGSHLGRILRVRRAASRAPRGDGPAFEALEEDLESMPPEVVLGRAQRFFRVDLREVLAEPEWQALDWHLDRRCVGCDYLGHRWASRGTGESLRTGRGGTPDKRYCWPMAEASQHLSRIAGLTPGACGKLREAGVNDVAQVAALPEGSAVLDRHQTLRAGRTLLPARARTLSGQGATAVPDHVGSSATLPRFADIRVAVSADFDVGSELTFAFGYRLDYGVPVGSWPKGPEGPRFRRTRRTVERPALVRQSTRRAEGDAFRSWLTQLAADIVRARDELIDGYRAEGEDWRHDAGIQFYLWDRLTFRHLCRVVGRHLDLLGDGSGERTLNPIAWVFPPGRLLQAPEFLTRSSPVTILDEVARAAVALPVPHHYGLIDVATALEPESRRLPDGREWRFQVKRLYRDPLNDQIPSERGQEIWNGSSPHPGLDPAEHRGEVERTVRRKLHAVVYIAERMTRMLGDRLTAGAPPVEDVVRPAGELEGVATDARILYQHTRLTAAALALEIELLMAMPAHEREARFHSARIEEILGKRARARGLEALGLSGRKTDEAVLLLRLARGSRDVRLRKGDFTWTFLPEADLPRLRETTVSEFLRNHPELREVLPVRQWEWKMRVRETLDVTVLGIDRSKRLLAVEAGSILTGLLRAGFLQADLDGRAGRYGILDPRPLDVFTPKLRRTLEDGIGNPLLASEHPLFPDRAVARLGGNSRAGTDPATAAAEFIWTAHRMAGRPSGIPPDPVLAVARELMPELTARQREAITRAIARRLALWWGPPGTGKSRTARTYVAALAGEAVRSGRPLRIAITGFTWVAIDNVARGLPELFARAGIAEGVQLSRLASSRDVQGLDPALVRHLTAMGDTFDPGRRTLERRLRRAAGVTVVAGTVHQLYKLSGPGRTCELFDVMLIDEASQLDVAHAVVAFSKLARGARVAVVGDPRQMPPIHPVPPPEGLEHLVGSVYDFFARYRCHEDPEFAVEPVMLDRSFRSSREIIAFVREAGYGTDLEASRENAGLRIRTERAIATARPAVWPRGLPFSPGYARILDPADPLVAVVHDDRFSSQRNEAEAGLAAGLVLALFRAGLADPRTRRPYSATEFFRRGVGIVTPHRAQQAAIYTLLDAALPPGVERSTVFGSVDTVERFQGQERALMLASFGLGDTDQIRSEEEFIYSLNRFNVTASRARAKFIALLSRRLVDHLPAGRRALEESRLLKHFVDGFLSRSEPIRLPGFGASELRFR